MFTEKCDQGNTCVDDSDSLYVGKIRVWEERLGEALSIELPSLVDELPEWPVQCCWDTCVRLIEHLKPGVKIVSGYINDDFYYNEPHTWLQVTTKDVCDGLILDPTIEQFYVGSSMIVDGNDKRYCEKKF